ncbi:MAG: ornithine cyclodeaminase [Endozoicomonadaceae bacterium]|nr:ornithine cyclodeaminase [Endozoicomonadaceae bacterium]
MAQVLSSSDVVRLIQKVGIDSFFTQVVDALQANFHRWQKGRHQPRNSVGYPQGVMELMPYADDELYSFKYVNGHPENPRNGKLTVTALGVLFTVHDGYPLLLSEMTLLTAIRTAATSALASQILAPKGVNCMAMIGCGAQSEFQILAQKVTLGIDTIRYFDPDAQAMEKLKHNLIGAGIKLIPCTSAEEAIEGVALITTATAAQKRAHILPNEKIGKGVHINAIGGDCPGKTELESGLLNRAKIFVEYNPQTFIEGEIQSLPKTEYTELWQLVQGIKEGRTGDELTIFDSVGYALEDFSILKLVHELIKKHPEGKEMLFYPDTKDPKDLYSFLLR